MSVTDKRWTQQDHDQFIIQEYLMNDAVEVLASRHAIPGPLSDTDRIVVDMDNTLTADGFCVREQLIAEAWGLA